MNVDYTHNMFGSMAGTPFAAQQNPQLTNENVVSTLEKASATNDTSEVKRCISYMTNFSCGDIPAALERYRYFYNELQFQKEYRKNLMEALFPLVKDMTSSQHQQETVIAFIQTLSMDNRQDMCEKLIELFFHKDYRPGCMMMIDVMNRFAIPCDSGYIIELYLPLLAEFCKTEDIQNISNCAAMLEKHLAFSTETPESLKLLADCLHGAYFAKSPSLLCACLRALSDAYVGWGQACNPAIFTKLHATLQCEGIEQWLSSLLIQWCSECNYKADFPTEQKIQNVLLFLQSLPSLQSPQQVAAVFAEKLSNDCRSDAVRLLLECASTIEDTKVLLSSFELINVFHLHDNPGIRKTLIELLARTYETSLFSQVLMKFLLEDCLNKQENPLFVLLKEYFSKDHDISKLVQIGILFQSPRFNALCEHFLNEEKNPVFVMLEEYFTNLPKDKHHDIFKLLQLGIRFQSSRFIDLCLLAIDRYRAHHLMPASLNCSSLLKINHPLHVYENIIQFTIQGDSEKTTFYLPRAIIDARAPRFQEGIANCSFSLEVFRNMMLFLAYPGCYASKVPSFPEVAKMYQISKKIGCGTFVVMAEQRYFKEYTIVQKDISLWFEVLQQAQGEYREKLKYQLLAHACVQFSQNKEAAKHVVDGMRIIDPKMFAQLDLRHLLGRVMEPKEYDRGYSLNLQLKASFVQMLKELAPEIEEMDLHSISLQDGCLKEIGIQYPALSAMSVQFQRKALVEEMAALNVKQLSLFSVGPMTLQILSKLPLRSLKLYDFVNSGSDKKTDIPEFFNHLEEIQFTSKGGISEWALRKQEISMMLPLLPKLKALGLDKCECTGEILQLVHNHAPDITSFSATLCSDSCTHNQLEAFCKSYPKMQALSLRIEIDKEDIMGDEIFPLGVVESLRHMPSLQSLTLPSILDNELLAKLVEDHPLLSILDIRYAEGITDESIAALAKLKNLQELNVQGTSISPDGLLQLLGSLPCLKKITIQIPKGHDISLVLCGFANKGIEVKVIEKKV